MSDDRWPLPWFSTVEKRDAAYADWCRVGSGVMRDGLMSAVGDELHTYRDGKWQLVGAGR